MRALRRISMAFVVLIALAGCPKRTPMPTQGLASPLVRETFESGSFSSAFFPCFRPENEFSVVDEQAREGTKSLRLTIHRVPLFAHLPLPEKALADAATSCLATLTEEEGRKYLNDESERAEFREKKSGSPHFTEDFYYGFSVLIPRAGAPLGDFNRMVVGQWKLQRAKALPPDSPPYDSPFLALRVTGGFFHVMLDVKAALKDGALFNYDLNQGQPAPPSTLRIERPAYLPNLWDDRGAAYWVDLIFHVKGGKNGIVEVWANGALIARATGWIGYADIDQAADLQYFKVGPYRDPAGYDTVIYLDNLARGHSYAEVDPSQP